MPDTAALPSTSEPTRPAGIARRHSPPHPPRAARRAVRGSRGALICGIPRHGGFQAGVIVTIIAAVIAAVQASDARQERIATEILRRDIAAVAANVTRMFFVLADGSGRWGGVPGVHRKRLEEYRDAMRPLLPSDLTDEIDRTIRDLDRQIQERNWTK